MAKKTRLIKKVKKDLKTINEPSDKLVKIAKEYGVQDLKVIDFESLIQLREDYSSDKAWITEVFKPKLIECGGKTPLTKEDTEAEQQRLEAEEEAKLEKEVEEKQERIQELQKTTFKRIGNKDKIIQEIINFAPHTEQMTISTLIAISQGINVINYGERGWSKTRCSKELLDVMGYPYYLLKGHITVKRLFKLFKMYNHPKSLIVIDESANLFRNNEIKDLLLSALVRGEIIWETDRESDSFIPQFTILFNSNFIPNSPVMRAVADRCITNKINLNSNQIKRKINSSRYYKPNKKIWEQIKNNLFVKCEPNEQFYDFIYKIINLGTPKSVRDKNRALSIGLLSLKLVGDLSLLEYFPQIDKIELIMAREDINRSEKVKMIANHRKVGVRQAQKIVAKMEA